MAEYLLNSRGLLMPLCCRRDEHQRPDFDQPLDRQNSPAFQPRPRFGVSAGSETQPPVGEPNPAIPPTGSEPLQAPNPAIVPPGPEATTAPSHPPAESSNPAISPTVCMA